MDEASSHPPTSGVGNGFHGLPAQRALFIAEAFGYGPASKLLVLLRAFPRGRKDRWTFLGNGCAFELCQHGPFDQFVQGEPANLGKLNYEPLDLASFDVMVSAMEFAPIEAARQAGLKTIIFDSLFWMWPELPPASQIADLYLCQSYLGVRERRDTSRSDRNLLIVPPLTLAEKPEDTRGDVVILNLGGMDNPHAPRDLLLAYAFCVVDVIVALCEELKLTVEVYGRGWVMESLRRRFADTSTLFASLPLEQFIGRLRRARCLVTSPGLEVLYEAFTLGVPAFLLPAQNNSQAYQARQLLTEIPRLNGVQWHELLGESALHFEQTPKEVIREALTCARRLHGRPAALGQLRGTLERFLCQGDRSADAQSEEQFEFIRRMRADADVSSIADLGSRISNLLQNQT
jgi:hypothetical protein